MQLIRPPCPRADNSTYKLFISNSRSNRRHFSFQVQQISSRLLSSYDINLDEFFSEIDSTIAASRDVFQQVEEKQIFVSENDWEKIQMQVGWLSWF